MDAVSKPRATRRKPTAAEVERVLTLMREGVGLRAIAEQCALSYALVHSISRSTMPQLRLKYGVK